MQNHHVIILWTDAPGVTAIENLSPDEAVEIAQCYRQAPNAGRVEIW